MQPVVGLASRSAGRLEERRASCSIDASNSMKGAPIQGATAPPVHSSAERKNDLPVAIIAFNPNVRRSHGLHDEQGGSRGGRRGSARHGRGNPHLRRAHRSREQGEGSGTRANDSRAPLRRRELDTSTSSLRRGAFSRAEGSQRPRHLGRTQVAISTRRRRSKSAREADRRHRTSKRTTPPRSSRSSRRSGSSSRASTSSPTARCFRPSRRPSSS